jgi:hypothetical protein
VESKVVTQLSHDIEHHQPSRDIQHHQPTGNASPTKEPDKEDEKKPDKVKMSHFILHRPDSELTLTGC